MFDGDFVNGHVSEGGQDVLVDDVPIGFQSPGLPLVGVTVIAVPDNGAILGWPKNRCNDWLVYYER